MTKDDIIRMAWEACGEPAWDGGVDWTWEELERFAELVATAEREECAKLFDGKVWAYDYREIALAIRERGAP
jgi:hypothetical protein